eukprot:110836-Prorocentrum_minimum.AAC.1
MCVSLARAAHAEHGGGASQHHKGKPHVCALQPPTGALRVRAARPPPRPTRRGARRQARTHGPHRLPR